MVKKQMNLRGTLLAIICLSYQEEPVIYSYKFPKVVFWFVLFLSIVPRGLSNTKGPWDKPNMWQSMFLVRHA